jgi:hypothetical protein
MNDLDSKENNESLADNIFSDFVSNNTKGIFARIPRKLHCEVLAIKASTGKSIYEIVEKSLKLFVEEYKKRNHLGGQE